MPRAHPRRLTPPLTGWLLLLALVANPVSAVTPPDEVLRDVTDQLIDTLKAEQQAIQQQPQRLFEVVDEALSPHVDFPRTSRWVLGKYWRQADEEQRNRFMEAFRTLLVRFYTAALVEDPAQLESLLERANGLITFEAPQIDEKGENAIVRSTVHLERGNKVPVHFRMHREGDSWKVFDVNVEGISLVTTYRSSFAQEIRQVGLEGLIERLEERNGQLLNQVNGKGDMQAAKTAQGE